MYKRQTLGCWGKGGTIFSLSETVGMGVEVGVTSIIFGIVVGVIVLIATVGFKTILSLEILGLL